MRARVPAWLGIILVLVTSTVSADDRPTYDMQDLRRIARSIHPTLASAEAAIDASDGYLRQARAWPNPSLEISFGRGHARDGSGARTESQFHLVQTIELAGIRRWRARLAEANLRGAGIDRALAGIAVDSALDRLVYSALLEERRAEIARESAGVAARLHDLSARRVELGEASPLEAVKARSEQFARRNNVLAAEGALAASRSALNLFCGGLLTEGYRIAESLASAGGDDLPADLAERLLARNPLLLGTAIAVEKAQARVEISRREALPGIDVFVGHEIELDRMASSVGAGLTIPLWNRNRGAVAAAMAEEAGSAANASVLAIELEISLEQASAAYRTALATVRLHDEGWAAASRQALNIATFSFENGEASLLDVLDAQRSYLEATLAEAESRAGLALARSEIEALIAGPLSPEESDDDR